MLAPRLIYLCWLEGESLAFKARFDRWSRRSTRSRFKFDELLFQSKFCLPLSDNRGNSFQRINWRSSRVIGYVVKSCCNSLFVDRFITIRVFVLFDNYEWMKEIGIDVNQDSLEFFLKFFAKLIYSIFHGKLVRLYREYWKESFFRKGEGKNMIFFFKRVNFIRYSRMVWIKSDTPPCKFTF